jgi:hypothetical protein
MGNAYDPNFKYTAMKLQDFDRHNLSVKVQNGINQIKHLEGLLKGYRNMPELQSSLQIIDELKSVQHFIDELPAEDNEAVLNNFSQAYREDQDEDYESDVHREPTVGQQVNREEFEHIR